MQISVFDMFKIGVGPSSSHTMGPWRAAMRFLQDFSPESLAAISHVSADLYGSLAKTGKGHGTDIAVQLGLCGEDPVTMDTTKIRGLVAKIADTRVISLSGGTEVSFDPKADIRFHCDTQLPFHPNALRLTARFDDHNKTEAVFYSVGGGFIVKEGETLDDQQETFPYPVECANDLLGYCTNNGLSISDLVMRNEQTLRTDSQIRDQLTEIKNVMFDCIHRGCQTAGTLPGGLNVHRRASGMANRLLGRDVPADRDEWMDLIKTEQGEFQRVLD